MSHTPQRLAEISQALQQVCGADLRGAGAALLRTLGYASPKTLETGGDPATLLGAVDIALDRFDALGGVARWRSLEVVFQLTSDELPALARGSAPSTAGEYRTGEIDSFVFLALDLDDGPWTRRQLVGITRELNRGFAMPAVVLFRHAGHATLAVIDRRKHLRDATRDVVGGRISLVKDIDLTRPHRAHVEILADLTLDRLRPAPSDFRALYDAWLGVLSASELNKRFYKDLADWFAWASGEGVVHFPPGQGNGEGDRQVGLIRLLTRLMFVWFIKQKGLAPDELFDQDSLTGLLSEPPHEHPDGHGYYLAVLQNLFFACLNTEMNDRDWLPRHGSGGSAAYLVHNKLRQRAMFVEADAALALFAQVPFLNGGLFDCLDVEVTAGDARQARATREGRGLVLRVDGFSEEQVRQPRLPNRLFFGGEQGADLSAYYGRPTRRDVPGLIDLFEGYKFTIEENTPLEEEAALDPELLGKVFENLLASYNEDTRTTARNKSGSFYTPREVVDFMVDQTLVAYLSQTLAPAQEESRKPRPLSLDFGPAPGELALESSVAPAAPKASAPDEARLRALLSYTEAAPAFTDAEADSLIDAIERCRAIDPAVGSGAFPLGLLQKLVHALSQLDPGGDKWRAANRRPLERSLQDARGTPSPSDRAERVEYATAKLAAFDTSFDSGTADYARKLYLIEGCLHGVDVQPIAVQIAKLRCFIALAVEQIVDDAKPNRGVTPLPNLEMKFVAANSLGMVSSAQGQLRDSRIAGLEGQLRDANAAFFSARDRRSKRSAQELIVSLRNDLADLLANSHVFQASDALVVAAWNPFDANAAAPFFDPEWMFGLEKGSTEGCFDIVLANPPYVRQEKIEGYEIDGRPANSKVKLRADYETFTGTADLYVYFYERSVRLLKPGGALAFITSNKWYRAGYGGKLRRWLSEMTRLRAVIDFGDAEVFEAIAYPTIVVAERRHARVAAASSTETFQALTWTAGEAPEGFPERFAREAFAMPQAALLATGWQLEPQGNRDLLQRLMSAGPTLRATLGSRVSRGITSGLNEAFVIDASDRLRLIEGDHRCEHILKPYLGGRNVERWSVVDADRWLIKIPSSENTQHPWSGKPKETAEKIFAQEYPSIYSWWQEKDFRQRLIERFDQGHYFWELRSCTYWDDFEEPKIVSTKISFQPTFAVDRNGYYLANTSYFFSSSEPEIVCAILNSSVGNYLSKQIFVQKQGGFYEVQPSALEAMPIPTTTPDQAELIAVAVEALFAGTQPRGRLESLLNAFVYELFFAAEFAAKDLSPFAAARDAGLLALGAHAGPDLAREAEAWSRALTDSDHPLYATLFALQSIDAVRIIEGR